MVFFGVAGNHCWLANVLWCDYCSVSFQSFSLRHLVKTKKRAKKFTKKCDACAEMFLFFVLLMKLIGFLLLFTFSLRGNLFSAVTIETVLFIYNDDNQILLFYPRQEYKQSCNNKSDLRFPNISEGEQGAKKKSFLQLAIRAS